MILFVFAMVILLVIIYADGGWPGSGGDDSNDDP